ncbi:hypothetical protein ACW2QC_19280 [Virgibacillus sp. FSP13]
MLTYRTEVREVSLVAGRWSWTWLILLKNKLEPNFMLSLSIKKSSFLALI